MTHIHIAICDDDPNMVEQVESSLLELEPICSQSFDMDVFLCADDLLKVLKKNSTQFDMIFMDIDMPGTDGVEFGHLLRDKIQNDAVLLIYISSHEERHKELFQVGTAAFVSKPIDKKEFKSAFLSCLSRLNARKNVFRYQIGTDIYRISQKEILYFESQKRNVNIVTVGGIQVFYSTMGKILNTLQNPNFVQVHRSYVVNFARVEHFEADCLYMENGDRIPISERRTKEVRLAIARFIERNEFGEL